MNVRLNLIMDGLVCLFSMSGESDPVESFVFDQGRIQMPILLFWTLDEPPFFLANSVSPVFVFFFPK